MNEGVFRLEECREVINEGNSTDNVIDKVRQQKIIAGKEKLKNIVVSDGSVNADLSELDG